MLSLDLNFPLNVVSEFRFVNMSGHLRKLYFSLDGGAEGRPYWQDININKPNDKLTITQQLIHIFPQKRNQVLYTENGIFQCRLYIYCETKQNHQVYKQ